MSDGEPSLVGRESFEAYVHARGPALTRVAYLLTGDHHQVWVWRTRRREWR